MLRDQFDGDENEVGSVEECGELQQAISLDHRRTVHQQRDTHDDFGPIFARCMTRGRMTKVRGGYVENGNGNDKGR